MAERLTNDQRRFINASMPVIERHFQAYCAQESELTHKPTPNMSESDKTVSLHAVRNMKYLTQLAIHLNKVVESYDDLGDTASQAGRKKDALECWKLSDEHEREQYNVVKTIMSAIRPQG